MKHNFHEFRKNTKLNMQNSFGFVDTESYSKIEQNKEILTFKLGCSIFWNRILNTIDRLTFYDINDFWNKLESRFNKENKELILFAHNTQFDFKMLNGFNELINRNWYLTSFYVRNRTFIMVFRKDINTKLHYTLHIWDTMNYANKSLRELGNSIGIKKLSVNFKKVHNKILEVYCKRDCFIIYMFIRKLISYLEKHDLSKLKATAGSLSLNIYRHRFYNDKQEYSKIYIHDWKKAIDLERKSYRGGITDCFRIGINTDIYKLDVNSEYPYVMEKYDLPNKLLFYSHESEYNQQKLFEIYQLAKQNNLGVIMNCTVNLPKNNAYILNRFKDKSMFGYGTFDICLCTPELNFIEKYGKILEIHEISLYRLYPIFKEFIQFFYNQKVQSQLENNKVNTEIAKLIMNTQYGKWGQKDILFKELSISDNFIKKNSEIIKLMLEKKKDYVLNNSIVYLGTIINDSEIYIINNKLYRLKTLDTNSKDSFVAICSFITSYARMLLIKYLKIANRKNVIYCDTDSLFTNQKGYDNLVKHKCISKTELGKLKQEGYGKATIYAPKFYDFNGYRKIKGVRLKNSNLIQENNEFVKYQIQLWQKLKTDLRNGISDKQIINTSIKTVKKVYDKGKIQKNGFITPFHVSEILV